jgi:hypothetical protein
MGTLALVLASDEGRVIAGSELHTKLELGGRGESLVPVEPDGTTGAVARAR